MKRILSILLSLCLLLTLFGCGKTPPAEPDADPSAPTETEPVSTPEGEPAVFSLRTLPDIGDYVSDEKKDYFFEDGPHDTFEPRDDYGEIVPYSPLTERFFAVDWSYEDPETGEVYSGTTDKSEEEYVGKYGFTTTDGKIITDGIYENIMELRVDTGERIYVAFPTRTYDMCGKMDLTGPDGSWMLHFDEQVDCQTLNYRVWTYTPMFLICTREWVKLYNFNGELVHDLSWVQKGSLVFPEIHYVSEDRLLVQETFNDGGDNWHDELRLYDNNGKLLSTLPEDIYFFDDVTPDGVIIASREDQTYMLLDLYGKQLNKTTYYEIKYDSQNECFYAKSDYDDSMIDVLDKNGKRIKTLDCSFYELRQDEGPLWLFDDAEYVIHDFDGNATPLDVDGKEIEKTEVLSDWDTQCGIKDCLYAVTPNNTLYVFDTQGHRLAVIPDVDYEEYENYFSYDDEDEDAPRELEKSYQIQLDNNHLIYQQDGKCYVQSIESGEKRSFPITDLENYRGVTMAGNSLYGVEYTTTDGSWNSDITLYDFNADKCLLRNAVNMEQFGSYVLILTTTHSYLLDQTGKTVLCLRNDKLV